MHRFVKCIDDIGSVWRLLCLQLVKRVADIPLESVVELTGTVQLRPAGQANKACHLLYVNAFNTSARK